jgi:hypothetical protein
VTNDYVYYIYTPAYVDWSAGIRVLHYLCDELNKNGFEAFVALHGPINGLEVSADLQTPILSQALMRKHQLLGRAVVAIYPETIQGNPLFAPNVIRWLLNYPSLLGGQNSFNHEKVLAYSETLAKDHIAGGNSELSILFVPAIRSVEIKRVLRYSTVRRKDLQVVYAQKHRALGGFPKTDYPAFVEITRFGKEAPRREQTLALLRQAALLHVYENTTVITEACLLGTPVLCHRNKYFSELIAAKELPFSGIAWSEDEIHPPDIVQNLKILKDAEMSSKVKLIEIFNNLDFGPVIPPSGPIKVPRRGLFTRHSLSRGFQVLTQKGPIVFIRFLKNYISR